MPTLGTPVGGGLLGVHCRHPLHGETELERVITPAADLAILDPPTLAPPGRGAVAQLMAVATPVLPSSSSRATAASETQAQGAQTPLSAEGDSAEFSRTFSGT